MAFSLTADIGCEYGGGVHCSHGPNKANFFGLMGYNRIWFDHDLYAVTLGGGFMNNPGRYLALVPPINGATAQTGTPYFTENPGQKLYQWDMQLNFQYMPNDWITWWTEATFRHSDVPYWSGTGGVTPPLGNTGYAFRVRVQQRRRNRRRQLCEPRRDVVPRSAHSRGDLGGRRNGQVLARCWLSSTKAAYERSDQVGSANLGGRSPRGAVLQLFVCRPVAVALKPQATCSGSKVTTQGEQRLWTQFSF